MKTNKFRTFIFGLSLCIALVGCEEDDSMYAFIDQPAEGKVNGTFWRFEDGNSRRVGEEYYIDLFLLQEKQGCDAKFPEGNQVVFTTPRKVGIYRLNYDRTDATKSRTVSLVDGEAQINYVASGGLIEITAIENDRIVGRLAARLNNDNFVNGNFTASLCRK